MEIETEPNLCLPQKRLILSSEAEAEAETEAEQSPRAKRIDLSLNLCLRHPYSSTSILYSLCVLSQQPHNNHLHAESSLTNTGSASLTNRGTARRTKER